MVGRQVTRIEKAGTSVGTFPVQLVGYAGRTVAKRCSRWGVEDNNNHLTPVGPDRHRRLRRQEYERIPLRPVIFHGVANPAPVFGMGPGGKDPFEYEGAYATPTGSFSISGGNVP